MTTSNCTDLVLREPEKDKKEHSQKDIKIRKNKRNRSRQKRKANSSSSNGKRAKLTSKERNNSMKRLGISSSNLVKKAQKTGTVEEEKTKIQSFLDQFFMNDANAQKFSEAEKRKFAKNFQKAFIDSKLGPIPEPKKPAAGKLKALPAPPVVQKVETKLQKKPTLQPIPKKEEVVQKPEPKVHQNDQKIGSLKMYNRVFPSSMNQIQRQQSFDSDSQYAENSHFNNNTDLSEVENPKYQEQHNEYSEEDDEEPVRVGMNYNFHQRMQEELKQEQMKEICKNMEIQKEDISKAQNEQKYKKVSNTFEESLPMFASFVNMYRVPK